MAAPDPPRNHSQPLLVAIGAKIDITDQLASGE
jgi:hypothetical protein